MKQFVLLAVMFILPKVQPLWSGMIVRCEQPDPASVTYMPPHTSCSGNKCECHWECEFGQTTESYVEDGNQKMRANGCAPKPSPISCPSTFPYNGMIPV